MLGIVKSRLWQSITLAVAMTTQTQASQADTWVFPARSVQESKNGQFSFTVIPRRDFLGASIGPLGLLSDNFSNTQLWLVDLVNRDNPVSSIVSDNGNWVLTFDEYHSMGYGKNAVVVYNKQGRNTHRFALTDFLPEKEAEKLPKSVSSIWWHCGKKGFIDQTAVIGIEPTSESNVCRYFNIDLIGGTVSKADIRDLPEAFEVMGAATTSEPTSLTTFSRDDEFREDIRRESDNSPPIIRAIRKIQFDEGPWGEKESRIIEQVGLLISEGADINAKNEKGRSALEFCEDLPRVALFLVEHGADPNVKRGNFFGPLETAIRDENIPLLEAMISSGVRVNYSPHINGSPLSTAVTHNSIEVATLLLDAGADVNRGQSYSSPLETAAQDKNWEIVDLLLSNGASVDNLRPDAALYLATYQNDLATLEQLLLRDPNDYRHPESRDGALAEAVRLDRVEAVEAFLRLGSDPDSTSGPYGSTLLIEAIDAEAKATMDVLLDLGANPNKTDEYGFSPLDVAIMLKKDWAIEEIIASKGVEAIGMSKHVRCQENAEHTLSCGE